MKFLVDMPLSPELARWLTTQGFDAIHAGQVGLAKASDTEIMARAKREQRTIVTADLDYPQLLAISGAVAPSVILFRGGNWNDRDVIVRMSEVLRSLPPDDIASSIVVVDRHRIRRRRLPIG